MVRQDNIFLGNAQFRQFIGNTGFGAVVLYPYPAVFDIQMRNTTVQTFQLEPACMHKLIVIVLCIENLLYFGVAV